MANIPTLRSTSCGCCCARAIIALDVGANLGAITIGMAERVGRNGVIHAFEPQRPIYEILAVNAGRWPNIVPHCAAVGAVPGSIHVPPRDYEGSATSADIPWVAAKARRFRSSPSTA